MHEKSINIVFLFDTRYLEPGLVSVSSFFYVTGITVFPVTLVYISADAATDAKVAQVLMAFERKLKAKYARIDLRLIKLDGNQFSDYVSRSNFSKTILYKAVLPKVFPNYENILFFDNGTIFGQQIIEFIHRLQKGIHNDERSMVKTFYGPPIFSSILSADLQTFPRNSLYPSTSLMYFDVERYNKASIYEKYLAAYAKHRDSLHYADQELFYLVLSEGELSFFSDSESRCHIDMASAESWAEIDSYEETYASGNCLYLKYIGRYEPWKKWILHPAKSIYLRELRRLKELMEEEQITLLWDEELFPANMDFLAQQIMLLETYYCRTINPTPRNRDNSDLRSISKRLGLELEQTPCIADNSFASISLDIRVDESPESWAIASNYATAPYPAISPIIKAIHKTGLSNNIIEINSQHAKASLIVKATDLSVIFWNWAQYKSVPPEIVFFPISKGNRYCGDIFWVRHMPFIKKIDTPNKKARLELDQKVPVIEFSEDVFFIGGVYQFGHFLLDVLPQLNGFALSGLGSSAPVIVSKLLPYQKELIKVLGLHFNFIEIDPPDSACLLKFKAVSLYFPQSSTERINYIRGLVDLVRCSLNARTDDSPRCIYLTRSPKERPDRITNHDEIKDYLSKIGFSIICGEDFDPLRMIEFCKNAKLFIVDQGTPLVNFIAYAPTDSLVIALWPEWVVDRPNEYMLLGGLAGIYPILDKILFVKGYSEDNIESSTLPFTYPLSEIKAAIAKAERFLTLGPQSSQVI